MSTPHYCADRFRTRRRRTIEVMVGSVGVGAGNPIRVQSMTTSNTQDVRATIAQAAALAEAGCEIVRVAAPNIEAARCLREIRAGLTGAGFGAVPLVADIHFLPAAAMEAAEHVEKVRINPGNYADRRLSGAREYSDADYRRELQRLHDAFSPLLKRCRELGRALRIGVNHGSLSDRIMNRHGDTPEGMAESALEFLRIAEACSFNQCILSMKASNPKVMIHACRLLVSRMEAENMHYPLHLGVTEAGDGDDGRIKSAIGIGSLLLDGLGDTIRVSLTEDSVNEIPVARALADRVGVLWARGETSGGRPVLPVIVERINPHSFARRPASACALSPSVSAGAAFPPRVIVRVASAEGVPAALARLQSPAMADTPAEGLLVTVSTAGELEMPSVLSAGMAGARQPLLVVEAAESLPVPDLCAFLSRGTARCMVVRRFGAADGAVLRLLGGAAEAGGNLLCVDAPADAVTVLGPDLLAAGGGGMLFTLSMPDPQAGHATGAYRRLAASLAALGLCPPLWIRATAAHAMEGAASPERRLLDASILAGPLLTDGIGDLLSVETESDPVEATRLAYNILQGAGARVSRAEFVACPGCGRTLFDLQSTTRRIRGMTGHLKGVKIAIMGCIVNGPGEMADADFGYVGGAPGRINLYAGRTCVAFNVPEADAAGRLIHLIRERGRWMEPPAVTGPPIQP